jgi:hypothetical protein
VRLWRGLFEKEQRVDIEEKIKEYKILYCEDDKVL